MKIRKHLRMAKEIKLISDTQIVEALNRQLCDVESKLKSIHY